MATDLNDMPPAVVSGLRVLVVDDNPDQATMLAVLVQSWGHAVEIAHTAAEAMRVADAYRPRVVLLDLGLPDRHGYDLADDLRRQARDRKLYFIVVTGWAQIADQLRSTASGIRHHLMKPVNRAMLRELLAAYADTNEAIEARNPKTVRASRE